MPKMEVCRLCAKRGSEYYFRDIAMYINEIGKVLPIVVKEEDGYPQKLCYKCENKLMELCSFHEQSTRTDIGFRKVRPSAINPTVENKQDNPNKVEQTWSKPEAKERDVSEQNFKIINMDDLALFSCNHCKRTYISEKSVLHHVCTANSEAKNPLKMAAETSKTNDLCSFGNNMYTKQVEDRSEQTGKPVKQVVMQENIERKNREKTAISTLSERRNSVEIVPTHSYTCSFCAMSFTRKTTLISHEQDHLKRLATDYLGDEKN